MVQHEKRSCPPDRWRLVEACVKLIHLSDSHRPDSERESRKYAQLIMDWLPDSESMEVPGHVQADAKAARDLAQRILATPEG